MIIVDRALERARAAEGRPIRVGMVGAGFMGRGIALQILTAIPGMELVAIANRTSSAREAYAQAGAEDVRRGRERGGAREGDRDGRPAVTDDPLARRARPTASTRSSRSRARSSTAAQVVARRDRARQARRC